MIKINRIGDKMKHPANLTHSDRTEDDVIIMRRSTIDLINAAGGVKELSQEINFNYFTVTAWLSRGVIPEYVARAIADSEKYSALGFTLERMRPDLCNK